MTRATSFTEAFEPRSVHSSRCSDRVWEEARQAADIADCSMSVFHETALQLLTRIVKERRIKLEKYDPEARWVAEILSRLDKSSAGQ